VVFCQVREPADKGLQPLHSISHQHFLSPCPYPLGAAGREPSVRRHKNCFVSPPGYASAPPAWRCTNLGRQGAGVAELLEAFDAVGKKHEKMEADKFNDDGTYKAGINQVGVACG
jgi:hypothetical protein